MQFPMSHLTLPVIRGLSLIFSFISTSIMISHYGVTDYSKYSVLMSIYSLNTVLDLGIGNNLISSLASEKLSNLQIRKMISGALSATFYVSLIVISITLIFLLPFLEIFNRTNQVFTQKSIVVLTFGMIISILGRLYSKILLGLHKNLKYGFLDFFTSLSTNFLVILFSFLSYSIYTVIASQTVISGLIGCILLQKTYPIEYYVFKFDTKKILTLVKNAKYMGTLQILNVLNFQIDAFLIGFFCSSALIAEYAVAWKIFSIVFILTSAFMAPLWAKSSTMWANSQTSELWDILKLRLWTALLIGISSSVAILGLNNYIFRFFTGSLVAPTIQMLLACSFFLIMYLLALPISLMLNGISPGKINFRLNLYSSVLNISATLFSLYLTRNNISTLIASGFSLLFAFNIPGFITLKKILT